jgi:3-dehydroquinate dehydratase type I
MERTVQRTARTLRKLEHENPDFIEIRFDAMKSASSISEIRDATDRPLIATNRSRGQGGFFSGTEEMRIKTLTQAAEDAFDYVDVELNTKYVSKTVRQLKQHGARVIVSYHDRNGTPAQQGLESILEREKRAGGDICKIVGTGKNYADSLRCLTFVNEHARGTRLVCFCMGRVGIASRVLSPIFGAYFTFASPSSGRETASGQIPIDKLRALYKELGVA